MGKSAISKVLVANRGEIAVRVIRAARDAGYGSVAVYAEPDADALFVRLADEAFALGGQTSAHSYLNLDKILAAAAKSGANAIHPGYGFLSENADFAQAVIDAGLIWIGPSPQSIRDLGDKVICPPHRRTCQRADGGRHEESGVDGGGRDRVRRGVWRPGGDQGRLRWRRPWHEGRLRLDEIPELSRVGHPRGGSGVRARRVLRRAVPGQRAARRGAGARRPARQRRGRRSPATARYSAGSRSWSRRRRRRSSPTSSGGRSTSPPRRSAVRPATSAPGRCEYLVQGDVVSFLEVNTRLQVEHPVTEETAGIDLVRQQFRIADGEQASITEDPEPRGHSFEFRINGEDPGRNFLPGPGRATAYREPAGPGVRVDSGVVEGSVVGGQFDSMLAKLIVTGEDRTQALERARRALAEFEISGLATVLPFHRQIVEHPAFVAGGDDPDRSASTPAGWRPSGRTPFRPTPRARRSTGRTRHGKRSLSRSTGRTGSRVSLPGGFAIGGGVADRPTQRNTAPRRQGGPDHASPTDEHGHRADAGNRDQHRSRSKASRSPKAT